MQTDDASLQIQHYVNYVIVDNPTFLLSENVAGEVRGLINYSLFSDYIVKWFENFLIPSMIKFKLALIDLQEYFGSNIYEEKIIIDRYSSEYEKVKHELKESLDKEERDKKLIRAAFLLARIQEKKTKMIRFATVVKQTKKSIDSLKLIDEKIEEELKRIQNMNDDEINDEHKLFDFMTKNIREKFEKLYMRIFEKKLNVRSLIDQELLREKLLIYTSLDEATLEVINSEKESKRKKNKRRKK